MSEALAEIAASLPSASSTAPEEAAHAGAARDGVKLAGAKLQTTNASKHPVETVHSGAAQISDLKCTSSVEDGVGAAPLSANVPAAASANAPDIVANAAVPKLSTEQVQKQPAATAAEKSRMTAHGPSGVSSPLAGHPLQAQSVPSESGEGPQPVQPADASEKARSTGEQVTVVATAGTSIPFATVHAQALSLSSTTDADARTLNGGIAAARHEPVAAPLMRNEAITIRSIESSTPDRIEIALTSGSSGTLTVRTQLGQDGTIHAVLRGAADAASALRAQKTELSDFLSTHAVTVSRIDIETLRVTPVQTVNRSADTLASAGEQHRGQDQREQRAHAEARSEDALDREERPAVEASVRYVSSSLPVYGVALARAGGWLSVRA